MVVSYCLSTGLFLFLLCPKNLVVVGYRKEPLLLMLLLVKKYCYCCYSPPGVLGAGEEVVNGGVYALHVVQKGEAVAVGGHQWRLLSAVELSRLYQRLAHDSQRLLHRRGPNNSNNKTWSTSLGHGLQKNAIRIWKFFFNDRASLILKFLEPTIICSWTENLIINFFIN